jgi:hypothetical protein
MRRHYSITIVVVFSVCTLEILGRRGGEPQGWGNSCAPPPTLCGTHFQLKITKGAINS